MNTLVAFQQAHARLLEAQRQALVIQGLIYCLCGELFPSGKIDRYLGMTVHYANNRCSQCADGVAKDGAQ
jgi:hypothetical protein